MNTEEYQVKRVKLIAFNDYDDDDDAEQSFSAGAAELPQSGKNQGKTKIFQGQVKVREFCKKEGKILKYCQSQ